MITGLAAGLLRTISCKIFGVFLSARALPFTTSRAFSMKNARRILTMEDILKCGVFRVRNATATMTAVTTLNAKPAMDKPDPETKSGVKRISNIILLSNDAGDQYWSQAENAEEAIEVAVGGLGVLNIAFIPGTFRA